MRRVARAGGRACCGGDGQLPRLPADALVMALVRVACSQPARGQRAQPWRRPRLGGVLSHVKKRRSTRLVSEQSERDRS